MKLLSRILFTFLLLAGMPVVYAFDATNPASYTLRFDGSREEIIYHSAADDDGNLYIVGAYNSTTGASETSAKLAVYASSVANPQQREQKGLFNLPASSGGTDLFVAKLNALGEISWVKTLGGAGPDAATGVVFDRVSGRVFVAGYVTGTATGSGGVGTLSATAASGFDTATTTNLFVAALSVNGDWTHHESMPLVRSGTAQTVTQLALQTGDNRATAPAHLQGHSLALAYDYSAINGAAVTLYIKGEVAVPAAQSGARLGINAGASYDITSNGGRWAFVSKMVYRENPQGAEQRWNWEWLTPVAGTPSSGSTSSITQIKVNAELGSNSPVYVSGYWSGTFASRVSEGATSGFVASLAPNTGQRNFVATVGGDSAVNALVVDDVGNLVVAGQIARVNQAQTHVQLTPGDVLNGDSVQVQPAWENNPVSSSRYKHKALVAKLSADGNWQWANVTGGRYATAFDLRRANDGSYYLTGGLGRGTTFNGLDPASPAMASIPNLELGTVNANNSITSVSLPARLADYAVSSPSAATSREVFSQAWHDATLNCPPGQTLNGSLCYASCTSPYYASGNQCRRDYSSYSTSGSAPSLVCPGGYQLIDSTCYEPCWPGDTPWLWDNRRCWDGEFSYARDSESASQQCPSGKQLVGGQCHDVCSAGYSRSGTSCVRDAHSYNRTTTATASCNTSANNFCKLRLAYSQSQIQLLRNGTVFGSTISDDKERGKASSASQAEIALTHYLDFLNPNPKSISAITIGGGGNTLLSSDQWQLRLLHGNGATDASYALSGNWNITFNLADGRTNTASIALSDLVVNGSTGARTVAIPFPTGYLEPELTPYSYAYVARFVDAGTDADFDWLTHSANRDTHGALLVLNPLQTLYLFGGRGHQPRLLAMPDTQPYATRDASGADNLVSAGTIMNVINPDSSNFLPTFLRYFDYVVGQLIAPPSGGDNSQLVGMLRRTVPAGMADMSAGGDGTPANGELLSAPSDRSLYAAAPLNHGLVLWPTKVNPSLLMQPVTGKAIRARWPTVAEGLQEYIYSTTADASLLPLLMNPDGASKTFHWIQYAQTASQEVSGGQTLPAGTKVNHGIRYLQASTVLETTKDRFAALVLFDGLDPTQSAPTILSVRSYAWNDASRHLSNVGIEIGSTLTPPDGANSVNSGYVMTELARYDTKASVYARASRSGQIIPVNANGEAGLVDDLIVAWYQEGAYGRDWPSVARTYAPHWPGNSGQITVASQLGSAGLDTGGNAQVLTGLHVAQNQPALYVQNNRALPGFNPNEEHALLYQASGSDYATAFALRTDLNHENTTTSDPYVLVRYRDSGTQSWMYRVFKVDVFAPPYTRFNLSNAVAGRPVLAPYPLNLPGMSSTLTVGQGSAYWLDKYGQVWSRSVGDDSINVDYAYRLQDGFWYDLDGNGTADTGITDVAWKDQSGHQITLQYDSTWPEDVPEIAIGDTLIDARNGLPGVRNMRDLTVVYDQNDPFEVTAPASVDRDQKATVRLFDFTAAVAAIMPDTITEVQFNGTALTLLGASGTTPMVLPARLLAESGHYYFPTLPSDLRYRLHFNPTLGNFGQFYFQGGDFNAETGRPAEPGDPLLYMVNIMTQQEQQLLKRLDNADGLADDVDNQPNSVWDTIVDTLYINTRNPSGIDKDNANGPDNQLLVGMQEASGNLIRHKIVKGSAALSAAFAKKPGYVVLAENVDEDPLNANPVNLHVIRVVNPKVNGSVRVMRNADNALDPRLVMRQSLDFGGRADQFEYDWWWHADGNGEPTVNIDPVTGTPSGPQWRRLEQGVGLNALTLSNGLPVLADGWVISRYRGLATDADPTGAQWSSFTGRTDVNPGEIRPVATAGWVRRVLEGINAFELRYAEFHDTEANSYISMLVQAGRRYEGDVALSTENGNLDQVGLIELYQTVLNSAIDLSIDATNPITNEAAVNKQLLLAASRIADFYLLLGNEAFSDAMDPTVGIRTTDGATGYLAPTLFAFKEQVGVDTLLDEELALLRGVDQRREAPVYNRLPWNFSSGNEGEPTYVQVYGISDTGGDGALNDARLLFPQAHGDAWGHYLTATKQFYALARHPRYDWQPLTDTTSIAGMSVQVDYKDEERFARAAAAKARTGARIVDLTFRQQYTHAPSGQWQGYKDSNADRAWGMDEWARRAGQGAVLDWALGNALLPYESTAPDGAARIDRKTVAELAALPAALTEIESAITRADSGANPFGLDSDAIPFDIDPTALAAGQTHFDQIYNRAVNASTNALRLFDYANTLSQQIRVNQLDTAGLQRQIEAQEQDYKSRLTELMGYPYAGDIGSGKLYPTGYTGPDLYHYMYIDGTLPSEQQPPSFTVDFTAKNGNFLFPGDAAPTYEAYFGVSSTATLAVSYPYSDKADYAFVAPASWDSRRAPGRLQLQLGQMQLIQARLNTASAKHMGIVNKIKTEIDLLEENHKIRGDQIEILNADGVRFGVANGFAVVAERTGEILEKSGENIYKMFKTVSEAPPSVVGFAFDATSGVRVAIGMIGTAAKVSLSNVASAVVRGLGIPARISADQISFENRITIYKAGYQVEIAKQLAVIENLMHDELALRLQIVEVQQELANATGAYQQLLGEAARLMEERELFRRDIASRTLDKRYQDMTYRVFRNDALQKYRASFDLAAKYTYLAAKAFDYETGLLSDDSADQSFFENLVRQRTLGHFAGGTTPMAGVEGLSTPLAHMHTTFDSVKGTYGFYTPLNEEMAFSLRREALRIGFSPVNTSQAAWQEFLQNSRVDDLWQVPEFRRYCRPPQLESNGPIPGLVLRFGTLVDSGRNLFGWPLGPGDHAYDSSRAATKFRSVGLHFDGYPAMLLSASPRAYLVPVGTDVLRSPTQTGALRQYTVLDQAIPAPSNLQQGNTSYLTAGWIPANDDVSESWANIRRFSQLPVGTSSVLNFDSVRTDTRLVGRSVWNTEWLLIIPGTGLLSNGNQGLDRLINGDPANLSSNGITDVRLYFDTYSTSGQ